MRASITKNGLTLRVIAGTHNAILGIDLQENKRRGCLGFSIQRTDLGPTAKPFAAHASVSRWLPEHAALPQRHVRPGDQPDHHRTRAAPEIPLGRLHAETGQCAIAFKVVPRYGKPGQVDDASPGWTTASR